ncbi:MAG: hypothetical protein GQ477_00120 [Nanohaloarchaea archaeon]|nr:hypothetical protein [Candidatus Nanohaloarchaea archaeon]
MSSQLSSAQESEMSKFLDLPVYELTENHYGDLISLLKRYDPSIIETKLKNSISIDSEKMGLEIFGCSVGSIMVNPDAQYTSSMDWYGLPLGGYIINHYGDDNQMIEEPNDQAYPFLEELQDIFSPVGTAKDINWKQSLDDDYGNKMEKIDIMTISILPLVIYSWSGYLFLSWLAGMVFSGAIVKTYYGYNKPQCDLTGNPAENIIFKTFDDVYNPLKNPNQKKSQAQ